MNKLLLGLAASLGFLFVGVLRAEDKPLNDPGFVAKALTAGRAEVKLGDLAQKNAASSKVREFGARMIKDHTAANTKLEEFAKNQRLTVAAPAKPDQADPVMRLSKLTGAEFDREYMKLMVEEHEKAVALFEGEAKNGQDVELKKFAETTLPTIQEHLKMAKDVSGSLKGK